jgi:hypothetical protein
VIVILSSDTGSRAIATLRHRGAMKCRVQSAWGDHRRGSQATAANVSAAGPKLASLSLRACAYWAEFLICMELVEVVQSGYYRLPDGLRIGEEWFLYGRCGFPDPDEGRTVDFGCSSAVSVSRSALPLCQIAIHDLCSFATPWMRFPGPRNRPHTRRFRCAAMMGRE